MVKTIYLVAGERLIEGVAHFGGLYANVGETERSAGERLKDEDYRRKNSGGEWKTLKTWSVESFVSDGDLHKALKSSKYADRIIWKKSSNTEEFYFIGDDGKGSVAIPIIQKELEELSVWQAYPAIVEKNKCLTQENETLKKSNESLAQQAKDTGNGDWLNIYASLQGELEEEKEEKTAAFLMLKEAMEELDALMARLEASTKEKDALRTRLGALTKEKDDLAIRLKKSIFSYKESAALKIRSLAALCVAALCFAWLVSSNANEKLETLAIANEQQVEEVNVQLANAEKENKTNLDKIAKFEAKQNEKTQTTKPSGEMLTVAIIYGGWRAQFKSHMFDVNRRADSGFPPTHAGSIWCKSMSEPCEYSGVKNSKELRDLMAKSFKSGGRVWGKIPY